MQSMDSPDESIKSSVAALITNLPVADRNRPNKSRWLASHIAVIILRPNLPSGPNLTIRCNMKALASFEPPIFEFRASWRVTR